MTTPLPSNELQAQSRVFSGLHEVCRDIRFNINTTTYRLLVVRHYIETGVYYTIEDKMMDAEGKWISGNLPDVSFQRSEDQAIEDAFSLIRTRFQIHD